MENDSDPVWDGLKSKQWQAMFRPGVSEFAASQFAFSKEAAEQVRIVFGNQGPYNSDGEREPVYTIAITLTPDLAVELGRQLIQFYAKPKLDRSP